jgi:superfamily II DNA or RNA helicase
VNHGIVTGQTPKKTKELIIQEFRDGEYDVLVGTASLATGTDGLDKMCDWLVILDDTDDDALRRQLIGRIMPRGSDTDASKKQVYRLTPAP